ncbi:MAG TPA: hypothetical protein DDZ80_19830, partial [Cyanobacteria bacterium UBA8803]|nr:hypothetical protein [Cyanobacteria bacterium UBA8803]
MQSSSQEWLQEILLSFNNVVWSAELIAEETLLLSPSAETVYGRPVSEFLENSNLWRALIHPDDRDGVEKLMPLLFSTEVLNLEYRIVRPSGEVRWLYHQLRLIRDANGAAQRVDSIAVDITDRQQAGVGARPICQIQDANFTCSQVQAIFNGALDAMLIADDEGKYIDANSAACELLGMPREKLLGCTISQFAEPRFDCPQAWHSFLAQGRVRGEFRILRPDGTVRDTEFAATANILPHRHLSVLRDITERKQAEALLTQKQRLFEQIAESTSAILYIYDLIAQHNVYSNRQITKILGYTPEAIQAMGSAFLSTLSHPEDREKMAASMERLFAAPDGEIVETEYRMRHANGEWRWLYSRDYLFSRTPEGLPQQVLGTATDITNLKGVEEELRQSEERLRLALEAARMGIWDWDILTNQIIWSKGHEELFGLTPGTFDGTYAAFEACIHPEDRAANTQVLNRALLEQQNYYHQYRVVWPDGSIHWVESKGKFYDDDTGQAVRMLGTVMDISDRKLAEAQILTLNAELEQRVIARTEEIGRVNEELRREIQERQQAQEALRVQTERERLIAIIAQHVRQSLKLEEILKTTVTEVRQFLQCDRVLMYRTGPDGMGSVIAEAVAPGCLPILGQPLPEEIFPQEFHQLYCQGRTRTVSDIEQDELSPCLADMLRQIGVKSKMVVAIVQGETLWGLLIAHQCSQPRQWQPWEVELLRSLATQVAIAIQQAELYSQLKAELTERQRIEAELIQSQQKYQTLFEILPIGISITDRQGKLLEANSASEKILGVSVFQRLYLTPQDQPWQILRPDCTPMPSSELASTIALTENRVVENHESGLLKPNGQITWLSATAAPMPMPHTNYGVVVTYIDITHRKQTELVLAQKAKRDRLLGEIGQRIRQSLKLEEILTTTVHEVREFLHTDRVLVHRFQPDGSGQIMVESLASGWIPTLEWMVSDPWVTDRQSQDNAQWSEIQAIADIYTAGLARYHIRLLESFQVRAILIVPIQVGNKLWGLLLAHHCTAPRQWQSWEIDFLSSLATQIGIALKQSQLYFQLETQLTELKQTQAELQQAKEAAEIANLAKSEFLATMSHELRTPLNGILGYAQLLKTHTNLTHKQQESLNIIHQCGEHLLTLINDILDLSKIEAQKLELVNREFNLPHLLKNLAHIFQLRARQKGIAFSYDVLSPLPEGVIADEKRLRQVLLNLLANAIKFTDRGGVTFKVSSVTDLVMDVTDARDDLSRTDKVAVAIAKLSATSVVRVRFQIEDTGIGIESSQLAEIFLPFHQVSDRPHAVEGTGLGLAISQKLVELMGGCIQVRSTLGEGSVFWFDLALPVVSGYYEPHLSRQRRLVGFKGDQRQVLIVDDNQINRSLLRDILEPLGLEIFEAVNGEDCLHKVKEVHPDLILMDLLMPVLDGWETTRRLRQLPQFDDVVVIALSANVFETTKQESLAAGCQAFLSKPVESQQLLELLMAHLGMEGIYEEGLHSTEVKLQPYSAPIIPPPPSEMAKLLQLVEMGDIQGIIDQAENLEKLDHKLIPFATQMRQLARGFKLKQIEEIIAK